jgi:hypothetical protein
MEMWLLVLLICVATFRATWFVTRDTFPPVQALRDWLDNRFGDDSAVAYLFSCLWCVSVWLGAGITAATTLFTSVPLPVLVWATASAFTGAAGTLLTTKMNS